MVATMPPPPSTHSKPHSVRRPVQKRKVANFSKSNVEEHARLRRKRVSGVVMLLFILGLIALVIWAAISGDPPNTDAMWEFQHLC